jgi:enoyl-CoA hydratase/carnithine racemase
MTLSVPTLALASKGFEIDKRRIELVDPLKLLGEYTVPIKLVHEVVAPDDLIPAALELARSIAANNAYGVWQTKIGLNATLDAPSLRHAIEIENRTQILSGFTNNPVEAAKAHMEKRAPKWDPL